MNASLYAYCPRYLESGKSVLDGHVEIIEMYDTGILDLEDASDLPWFILLIRLVFGAAYLVIWVDWVIKGMIDK